MPYTFDFDETHEDDSEWCFVCDNPLDECECDDEELNDDSLLEEFFGNDVEVKHDT